MKEVLCGIYLISNIVTDEHYVGQSVNILMRWQGHRASWRKGSAPLKLMESVHEHGEKAFKFSVIQLCSPRLLDRRELYWIRKLQPTLNVTLPAWAEGVDALRKSSATVRRRQAAMLGVLDDRPRCECGAPRTKGEKYCGPCRKRVLKEMKGAGYLTRTYRDRPKPGDRRVNLASLPTSAVMPWEEWPQADIITWPSYCPIRQRVVGIHEW